MKIIPLSEGSFTIDKSKLFVPFDNTIHDLQERSTGSLLVEVQPFVVVTSEDILLLDTGLGFEHKGVPQLHSNLMDAGINPGEVTKVLMSHLHKDHAGGVSHLNQLTGEFELSFPNATYYIQRKEMAFALEKGFPSYMPNELDCLVNAPNVVWLDGDGVIAGYIQYQLVGGHCPYHQVFRIVDGGETAFFGGDNAPQLQQMKSRFVAKYDADGKKAMELRQEWWRQGQSANWQFLFYHDIKTPVFP
ncbi:MBL fold metallo-hydrolase [Flavihumibacter fluvii]|uniref:MBL fold metallo-hydrolase n=1 Tax=Flavihumibacter fluvii TaxID=2838157 RepID=UPI001BDF6BB2|nr:MBL fold metallo-hydrolase [Flavihumibacter fluvii]ULQ52490.1 MBL fold metallo-hydrolase [Flavihumibacter fluvii]